MSSRRSSDKFGSAGGSGKKSGSPGVLPVTWSTCPTCNLRFPNRNLLQKHVDLGCGDVYPSISDQGQGVFELIQGTERFGPNRDDDLLFLNPAMVLGMELKTLDWVSVSLSKLRKDGEDDEFVPIGLRVVCSVGGGFPYKAQLTENGVWSHPTLTPGRDIISIKRIQDHVPLAVGVTCLLLPTEEGQRGVTAQGLRDKLESWLEEGRLICLNSTFRLQYLTYEVTLRVTSVHDQEEGPGKGFRRVSKETQIQVDLTEKAEAVDGGMVGDEVGLESVGGLDEEIKELQESILYALAQGKGKRNVARGFLLYGEHGTGKTLLAKALCTSLSLAQVPLENYGRKGLRKAFHVAVQMGKPAAIIIRNVDSHSSTQHDGGETGGFPQELREEMDRLPGDSPVFLLGTSRNPDLVDAVLRSSSVFAKEVELPVPSVKGRLDILTKLLNPFVHSISPLDLERVANETHGFVGGDLEGLRMSAFRLAGKFPPSIAHFGEALKTASPSAMKSIQLEIPHVRWDDIGGLHELKLQLQQAVEWPLKHPESFERLGLSPPKGLLMYGPPGCSKTMIAKALATESAVNFLSVKGSDLMSKWVGESEKAVQRLFRKARQVAPAILFFDELDALGSERGGQGGGSNVHERVLAQLLVEMDGIEPLKDVTILAATNRPDLIDKALTRPGRLDRIIYVPLPDEETRREILRIKLRRMPLGDDVSLDFLVKSTEGHSGAEIGGICQEAGMKALENDLYAKEVRKEHFIGALANSGPRITPKLLSFYASFAKQTQSS